MKIDALDRKILNVMQDDCHVTAARLGEQIGLSASAVQRRLDRLRAGGVIEREVALVSPEAAGRPLLLVVEVSISNETAAVSQRFREQVRTIPQILQCYAVTGSADYVMIWAVTGMNEYNELSRALFTENERVVRFITSVVTQTVKYGHRIPIDEE